MTTTNRRKISLMFSLVFIVSFIFNLLPLSKVRATSAGDQAVIYAEANGRKYTDLKFPNGTLLTVENDTFSKADGTRVFCLEPVVPVSSGKNHKAYTAEDSLLSGTGKGIYLGASSGADRTVTKAQLDQAKLWVYYGWDSSSTKTVDEYNAIQTKIWQIFWGCNVTWYNTGADGVSTITNIWNRVQNLINNHGVLPNLSGQGYDPATNTLTLEAGQTVTLTDSNNVIGKGVGKLRLWKNTSNATVQVGNGALTITAPDTETAGSLEFRKIEPFRPNPTSIVWFDGSGQKLLETNDPDPQDFALNFNSKPSTGDITFTKTGENGELLDGGEFQLQTGAGTVIKNFTTNGGRATLSDLKAGTYKIVEIKAPQGYNKGTDTTVTVTAGGTATASISNAKQKGKLTITKSGEAGEALAGAKFKVTSDNGFSREVSTDSTGSVVLNNLDLGNYTVEEITPPKGYKLSEVNIKTANLSYNPSSTTVSSSVSFANERQEFTVEVFKQDQDTKNPLAGATFEIVDPNGKVLTTVTTDNTGKVKTIPLKILVDGTYKVREVEAPKGYKSNSKEVALNIAGDTSNNILEYKAEFSNEVIKAPVVVQKYDLVNGLNNPKETSLAGAKFEIITKSLDNPDNTPYKVGDVVDTLVTNEEGKAKSKDLYLGTYELKEVEAPKGFVLNTETVSFSLTQNGDTAKINQLSENTEKVLAGLNKQVEELNITWKTKEAKREAEPLFEVNKPQVEAGTITFADRHILGRIDLNKVLGEYFHKVGDPKKPEANIQFDILDKDGKVVDSIITNKYGYGSSKYLPFGTYTLKQITETEYSYNVADQKIVIEKDLFNHTYQLENKEVTSRLRLVKLDKETGKQIPQANVSFEIYKKDGTKLVQNIYYPERKEISLFKTSEHGTVELPEPLVAGEYYIKEVDFPKNYVVEDTKIDFTVSRSIVEKTSGVLVIDITNKPAYGEIVISKTGDVVKSFNETTETIEGKEYKVYNPVIEKSLLAGVKFDIYAGEDIYSGDGELKHKQGDKVTSLETNDKEPVKTDKLYFGKYIIKEVEAPKGYARHTEDFVIELTHKEPTQELISESFSLNNQLQTAKLSVKKHMEESKHFGKYDEALKKVVFALVTKEELKVPQSSLATDKIVGIARPDKDGIVRFKNILPGKYRLVELSTSNAYELSKAEDVEFTPENDNTVETELTLNPITNKLKKYNLEIFKVDADDPNFKLAGAKFALYVKQGDKYVEVNRGVTVKGGKLRFEGLNSGNYYLREIKAPDTHVKRPTLYQFSTENSAETIYTTFENNKTTVEISKVDIAGKEIPGAKLEVIDKDGKTVDSWISEEGKTHVIRGLRKGEKYTLRETLAPAEYVKAQDIEFTVNADGSTTRVEMLNELTTVEVSKVDIAGKEIPGAKLEVIDKDGKTVDSWISEEGKTHVIRGLRKGEKYTLRETLAPAGYVKAQDIEFTVNADGSTTRVEMLNELVPTVSSTGERAFGQVIGITLLASAMVGFVLHLKKRHKNNQ